MAKSPENGRITLYCWMLLASMTNVSSETSLNLPRPAVDMPVQTLELDRELRWQEVDDVGPRCFNLPLTAGTFWIEVTSSIPSTAPELLLFAPPGESPGDETPEKAVTFLERGYSMMITAHRPGDYVICLASQLPLGDVQIRNVFVDEVPGGELDTKEGDELELELEEDPFTFEPPDEG